jgi:hypothetical protein
MASVSRPYRLVNGKRRRNPKKMSLAQKLHFGTKRQRNAAKASLGRKRNAHYLGKVGKGLKSLGGKPGYVYTNPKGRRKNVRYVRSLGTNYSVIRPGQRTASQGTKPGYLYSSNPGRKKRKKNVGEILTVFNPGTRRRSKKNNMAMKRRKRRGNSLFSRRRRRRGNPMGYRRRIRHNAVARYTRRKRRGNPGGYRRRRHTSIMRRYPRRNPDFLTGEVGVIVGVLGGSTLTSLLMGTLQSTVTAVSSGIPAYVAGAVVAFLQGKLIGKFTKNPQLGKYMSAGGYTWVALTMLHDLLPSFPNPFSNLSGLGLLTTSNNWGPPWVNTQGSMTRFVRPGGVVAAIPPPMPASTGGMHGLGRVRRMGRLA